MKLKTHNMAHKQRTPFTLKSGNKTSFKAMGSSPMRLSQLSPEMMKAQEMKGKEIMSKMQADGRREHAEAQARAQHNDLRGLVSGKAVQQGPNTMGGYKGLNQQGPNTIMNAQAPALTPEQKFALSSTSVRTPVGASRPQEQGNPVQAPQAANMKQGARGDYENFERKLKGEESSSRSRYGQVRGLVNTNAQAPAQPNTPRVAVQSAPRPDLSGGPRQPMGRPMGAPRQPMGGLGQPMGGPGFGGPGQLPPNKGRRKPGMGSGMGRARRATGLARRARRAAGQVRRLRRSKG
jgi:hypothetical protein